MTNEEKQKILEGAVNMAYSVLQDATPDEFMTSDVRNLLGIINELDFMIRARDDMNRVSEALAENPVPAPVTPAPTVARVDEPVTPAPAPAPAPAKATISKEEVRDKLSTYSNKYDSLDVAAIMSEMGYGKLSDIPADRYGELIDRVEAHIKDGV